MSRPTNWYPDLSKHPWEIQQFGRLVFDNLYYLRDRINALPSPTGPLTPEQIAQVQQNIQVGGSSPPSTPEVIKILGPPGLDAEEIESLCLIPGPVGAASIVPGPSGIPGLDGEDGMDGYPIPGPAGAVGPASTIPGPQGPVAPSVLDVEPSNEPTVILNTKEPEALALIYLGL